MKRLLLFLWFAAAPLLLAGQDYQAPEVKISTDQVRIGEKLYYVHTVLPKQTVFSICKAYGVTTEELTAANPGLENGLKANSLIYIPVKEEAKVEEKKAEQVSIDEGEPEDREAAGGPARVIEHKVRLFESARSIARNTASQPTSCSTTTASVRGTSSPARSC